MQEDRDKILTIKELADLCNKLVENGFGELPVKCQDAVIHSDEISVLYHKDLGHMQFRSHLFHQSLARKISKFERGFKKLQNEFYGNMDEA